METEDTKIKRMFDGFQPRLTSSPHFMERLKRNMQMVEFVREQNLAMRRRTRLAVAIAAACGFVAGVLMTLLMPLVGDWMSALHVTLPELGAVAPAIEAGILAWVLVAGVVAVTARNAYEIAIVKLPVSPSAERK